MLWETIFTLKITSFVVSLPSANRFGQDELLLLAIGIPLAILWLSMGILMVGSMEIVERESTRDFFLLVHVQELSLHQFILSDVSSSTFLFSLSQSSGNSITFSFPNVCLLQIFCRRFRIGIMRAAKISSNSFLSFSLFVFVSVATVWFICRRWLLGVGWLVRPSRFLLMLVGCWAAVEMCVFSFLDRIDHHVSIDQ